MDRLKIKQIISMYKNIRLSINLDGLFYEKAIRNLSKNKNSYNFIWISHLFFISLQNLKCHIFV